MVKELRHPDARSIYKDTHLSYEIITSSKTNPELRSAFPPCRWGVRISPMCCSGEANALALGYVSSSMLACPATSGWLRESEMQSKIGVPACVSLGVNSRSWDRDCGSETPCTQMPLRTARSWGPAPMSCDEPETGWNLAYL